MHSKACVCQICQCGRHKCPSHPQASYKYKDGACPLSEYKNVYKQHPFEKREPFKPAEARVNSMAALDDKTTQRVDYVPYPYQAKYNIPSEKYMQPEGDFDHSTTYKREYFEKDCPKPKLMKKIEQKKNIAKFSGNPTYKDDYKKWIVERMQPVTQDHGYRPSSAPFDGKTSYTINYTGKAGMPQHSMRPLETKYRSDVPFDGITRYELDYPAKDIPKRFKPEPATYIPNKVAFDDLTVQKRDYTEKYAEKLPNCKPDGQSYASNAPFESGTTHRKDFIKHQVNKPTLHEYEKYSKPDGDIDFHTTHRDYFMKKPIPKTVMYKPMGRRSAPGKFDGSTSYYHDYKEWSISNRTNPKTFDDYVPNTTTFEGMPTYKSDYISHEIDMRTSMRPNEAPMKSNKPFDDTTRYKTDYQAKELPQRFVHEKPQYSQSNAKLDDLTTTKRDYDEKKGGKMCSFKPDNNAYTSTAPFDDKTTQKNDYQKWPTMKPYYHEKEKYMRPEGKVDYSTTHLQAFDEKPIQMIGMLKPPCAKKNLGKFEGVSDYKDTYRVWSPIRNQKVINQSGYVPPECPFEGITENQAEYFAKTERPRSSIRPKQNKIGSNQPFDDTTAYKIDYTRKVIAPCPAGILETSKSGYNFNHEDSEGHKYYSQCMKPGVNSMQITIAPLSVQG